MLRTTPEPRFRSSHRSKPEGSAIVSIFSSLIPIWWFPKIRATLFGGPYIKDYTILGSILGFPYVGQLLYNPLLSYYT